MNEHWSMKVKISPRNIFGIAILHRDYSEQPKNKHSPFGKKE
jgi:hypothetical protein